MTSGDWGEVLRSLGLVCPSLKMRNRPCLAGMAIPVNPVWLPVALDVQALPKGSPRIQTHKTSEKNKPLTSRVFPQASTFTKKGTTCDRLGHAF